MQRSALPAGRLQAAGRGQRVIRAAISSSDRQPGVVDAAAMARALAAAAAVSALVGGTPGAARAADDAAAWKPRRHHRHIGQRFSDTWADAVVEVGPAAEGWALRPRGPCTSGCGAQAAAAQERAVRERTRWGAHPQATPPPTARRRPADLQVQESDRETIRELQRQLAAAQRRADVRSRGRRAPRRRTWRAGSRARCGARLQP